TPLPKGGGGPGPSDGGGTPSAPIVSPRDGAEPTVKGPADKAQAPETPTVAKKPGKNELPPAADAHAKVIDQAVKEVPKKDAAPTQPQAPVAEHQEAPPKVADKTVPKDPAAAIEASKQPGRPEGDAVK